jgi:hypothetical protein
MQQKPGIGAGLFNAIATKTRQRTLSEEIPVPESSEQK